MKRKAGCKSARLYFLLQNSIALVAYPAKGVIQLQVNAVVQLVVGALARNRVARAVVVLLRYFEYVALVVIVGANKRGYIGTITTHKVIDLNLVKVGRAIVLYKHIGGGKRGNRVARFGDKVVRANIFHIAVYIAVVALQPIGAIARAAYTTLAGGTHHVIATFALASRNSNYKSGG